MRALIPERGFFVSCQARPGSPLHNVRTMTSMAEAAVHAGAHGIRANGHLDIESIAARVDVPIIGIAKREVPGYDVYITPSVSDAEPLVAAGAQIVALDGTPRQRPAEDLAGLTARLHELGAAVMADVDTLESGRFAARAGVDILASTLSGYTGGPAQDGPDLQLVEDLAREFDGPVIAEGRYWTPEEVAAAYDRGARAVVVGSAITSPERIVARFLERSR